MGTAGWAIPPASRERFSAAGTHLQRYAKRLRCAEINSTFYRAHRPATYERWAASVPAGFAFSLKIPKAITHTKRLTGCEEDLARFLHETSSLGGKRTALLAQFAPSHAFEERVVGAFLDHVRARYGGFFACEPRHPSWFSQAAEALLAGYGVARVAADPAILPAAAGPGGANAFCYFRWHGRPRTYYSRYDEAELRAFASAVRARPAAAAAWCIFDNTALGAATENALDFEVILASLA